MEPGAPDPELVSASAMVFVPDLSAPELDEATAHHVTDVLRLRPDEVIIASDGAGSWVRCRLSGPADRTLVVDGDVSSQPGPEPPITVGFVPTKGARPEWVAQKLTELGVDRMVPLWSRRSVVRWEGARADRASTGPWWRSVPRGGGTTRSRHDSVPPWASAPPCSAPRRRRWSPAPSCAPSVAVW